MNEMGMDGWTVLSRLSTFLANVIILMFSYILVFRIFLWFSVLG